MISAKSAKRFKRLKKSFKQFLQSVIHHFAAIHDPWVAAAACIDNNFSHLLYIYKYIYIYMCVNVDMYTYVICLLSICCDLFIVIYLLFFIYQMNVFLFLISILDRFS